MFDRFSNHPTPSQSPGPRSYSPATRKPTHLAPQRPPFGPRSSSLSLVSRTNSSTESLPKVGRTTNGSALRQELSPPPDVEDPLRVLERVVGASIDHSDSIDHDTPIPKPTELSEDIDFKGSSLEAFITESPKTRGGARPRAGTIRTVEECEYVRLFGAGIHRRLIEGFQLRKKRMTSRTCTNQYRHATMS